MAGKAQIQVERENTEEDRTEAEVIDSPRFWGKFAVLLPSGVVIHCHNLKTAREIRDSYNNE